MKPHWSIQNPPTHSSKHVHAQNRHTHALMHAVFYQGLHLLHWMLAKLLTLNLFEIRGFKKKSVLTLFPNIFFFSETIMFLHQIFYQGLKARIASWPTLVLGKKIFSNFFVSF